MKDAPEDPPVPVYVRAVWWVRGWLAWFLRDRRQLKREGWRKRDDGWRAPDG